MKKMSMSAKVFLGFGIGAVLGLVFQEKILFVQPVGDLFLKLIQMIVIPLIFCSIISGIASIGDVAKLKRIGTKVIDNIQSIWVNTIANTVNAIEGSIQDFLDAELCKISTMSMEHLTDESILMVCRTIVIDC